MNNLNSHYRWLVVAVTIVNQAMILGVIIYSFALFSLPWLETFGVSRGKLMLAIAIFQVAIGLVAPLLGPKLDGMPLLWPVIVGFVVFSSGLAILSVANAYWQVIAVYAVMFSVGNTLCGTFTSQLLINRWFTTNNGLALGISATGTSLGGVVLPLLVAQALSEVNLSVVFQTLALFSLLVLAPLNYIVLRVPPPDAKNKSAGTGSGSNSPMWTNRQIFSSAAFWIPLMVLLPISTSFVAIQANLGTHLNDLSYPTSFTSQLIALIAAMMFAGKLMYGKLADKLDHRYLLTFMAVSSILALVLLTWSTDKGPLLVAAILLGISSGGLLPVMGVVLVARFGLSSFGKVMGLVFFVMIAGSLGPIYAAGIYDYFGSYNYAFMSFIVLLLPGLLFMKMLPPPLSQQQPSEAVET